MRWFLPGLFTALALAGPAVAGSDGLGKPIEKFSLRDADGKAVALEDYRGRKAVVVVFLSFECPVSTSYAAALADLARSHGPRGAAFLGIDSSDELAPADLARQARTFGLPFPVLRDERHQAADAFRASTAPEAFVLDRDLVLRYRGRIDDAYAARLKKNTRVSRHDLREALDEVLAGRAVSVPATAPIGCPIPRDEPARTGGAVTYYRDVLPILQAHCQECHRPGEVGPFSLMTYRQAVNWAADIQEYTRTRQMPPWKPSAGGPFHHERRLADREIATLAAWAEGGTPAGDEKDAPPPRRFTDGWQLGKPDLVLTVPDEMTLGPSGNDLFRVFPLPTNLDEDKYVTAVEVRPGNKRVVHHALLFIDRTGQGRKLEQKEREREKKPDEPDRGPGYSVSMGIGFLPQGGLGGWAPGQQVRRLPENTCYLLPRGADVILQLHYHRDGREEKDRTVIGLHFAPKPVERRLQSLVIPGRFLFIPAGAERYRVKGTIEVDQACDLQSVMAHMHMLGRQITVTLTPPQGTPRPLLAIDDWDYNWQETYFLQKPLRLEPGTRLTVEAVYDNSSGNPRNPFDPPRFVRFGEQTTNEMCFVFLGATSDRPGRISYHRVDDR